MLSPIDLYSEPNSCSPSPLDSKCEKELWKEYGTPVDHMPHYDTICAKPEVRSVVSILSPFASQIGQWFWNGCLRYGDDYCPSYTLIE